MGSKAVIGRWRAISILWSSNYSAVTSTFEELAQHGTWSFGLMHELGHVFNLGNSSWNWNDEMFANFRMQYGLEQNQGKVWMDERVYTGREILDMYKKDYDNTVYTQVNDNGIHYLGRLAGRAARLGTFQGRFPRTDDHGRGALGQIRQVRIPAFAAFQARYPADRARRGCQDAVFHRGRAGLDPQTVVITAVIPSRGDASPLPGGN